MLRLDLNVPLENGKIIDTTRIDKILPTLNFLIQSNSKIIILSHVGRPKGKIVKELSLKTTKRGLAKKIKYKCKTPIAQKILIKLRIKIFLTIFDENFLIFRKIWAVLCRGRGSDPPSLQLSSKAR